MIGRTNLSITYAILGILSFKALTGYDIKKIMQDSSFMYWSGNNNQIYKALVELLRDGLVTNVVQHQEGAPSKKIYTITEDGLAELKRLSLSLPEAPEFKKSFLVQFAWTWQIENDDVSMLLNSYEQTVKRQMMIAEVQKNSASFSPNRTMREGIIWGLIHENIVGSYQAELNWIEDVRKSLMEHSAHDLKKATAHNKVRKTRKL